MCEANDRSGYVRATLAPRTGMSAAVPPLRPRPLLTMKDMGMAGHDMSGSDGVDHSKMDHSKMKPAAVDHSKMDHAAMGHDPKPATPMKPMAEEADMQQHNHPKGPGVVTMP